jgi:hypothetical protein
MQSRLFIASAWLPGTGYATVFQIMPLKASQPEDD